MAIVTVEKNSYTADSVYQWDLNQTLEIRGLSLPRIPEIHFTNGGMDKAIVRQARMNDAGIITADIPNSLLQKPSNVIVYVCMYTGDTFESLYKLTLPMKARQRPADYTIELTDGEVYSFKALENLCQNILDDYAEVDAKHKAAISALNSATANYNAACKVVEGFRATIAAYEEQLAQFDGDVKAYKASLDSARATFEQTVANYEAAVRGYQAAVQNYEAAVIEYNRILGTKAETALYTVTVPVNWSDDGYGGYMQTVSVDGILSTDTPIADLVLGTDNDANDLYLAAWFLVTRITAANNSITLYANNGNPGYAFTIQLKVVR